MPIFEYQCGKCNTRFERFSFGEEKAEDKVCPQCAAPGAERVVSSFSSSCGCGDTSSGGCAPTPRRRFS
jgi:putative FmdB family regulatory protein